MPDRTSYHTACRDSSIEILLSRIPLLSGLNPDEITAIARGTRDVRTARGDILFHKGDQPTGFHLIAEGQIKLGFTSSSGAEKVIDIMGPGQTFGEAAMFNDQPYPVFAQALMDSRLLHISRQAVLDSLERDPGIARRMIASLSVRLHHLVADVESYSLHSGRQRIIGYLLRENMETEARTLTVTLPASKGTIASRLNLTQEHFSRILHELSEAGLIAVEGRKITIPDVDKLRGYDF